VTHAAQWFPGNHAIPIGAGMPPATVVSGSLAVFAVDRETGERLHLFSLISGDSMLPLAIPRDAAWEIAAIPLETSCLQPTADLREWERIFALENWLAKIGEPLALFRPATHLQFVEAGRTLNLKTGQRVAVEQGIVFLRLEAGEGSLSGVPVAAGATVALIPGLWLEAAVASEWTSTADGDPATLAITIDLAVRCLFEALDDLKKQRETVDRERFRVRQELNHHIFGTALGQLAGIAGKGIGTESERPSGDPLFDAVRAAAAALGATARPARGAGQRSDAVREIATASGIRTRTVVLAGEWWRRESGPLVTHRDNGNAVALLPRRAGRAGGGYEILDAVAGTREKATRSTAATLNAFAQMLYRPLPEDLSARSLLRHALGTRPRDLRTIVVAGVGAAVLALAAPQGFAILIGQAIPDADSTMLWQVGGGILAAAFGSAAFLLVQAVAILRVQSAAFMTTQTGVWDHLLKLSPAFFRGFTAGQLRIRADAVTRIHQLLTADALRSLFAGMASFLSLAFILWYSPVIAAIALVSGLAVAIHTWFGARALFRVQAQWQKMEELLSGLVLQSINGVSKLRVAGAGNRAFSHWAREYSRMQKLALAVQAWKDRIRLFNLVLPTIATALAFFYLLQQTLALSAFLACLAAMTGFLTAVTSAGDSVSGLILAANKWQQVRTILAVKPEVDSSTTHPGRLRGAIHVENLTFRYRSDGPMILDGVSITAEPGECIALTGPSGSGKSTLLNLILRFETPHSGAIYLDGRELSSLDITAVRRQIGVVTQDGRIMAGSLFENICCSGVNTMDEAWEAARAAGLAEDIEAMAMGMHTFVSEGGGNLSGGQRQRVLIARALVLKPAILVFDEATSALDNRTQAIVTESLNRLKATRIVVAHRLSTIRRADRIYVIEKGKVIQQGRFEDLAGQPGLFARLASRQKA
jgi:NHLM bacteriocin system ABC transporter ATP-binding protein